MRLMVAIDNRFERTKNGNIYSTTVCDYSFWCRYLQVFDEVIVLARLKDIEAHSVDKQKADGPKVSFVEVPNFIGPIEYVSRFRMIDKVVENAISKADAYLLHAPGTVCSVLWKYLRKYNKPYSVEVVGDPWDSLAPGTMKSIFREFSRRWMRRALVKQCRKSVATTYVTESMLQRRYPAGGWQTFFSDVNLPAEVIINNDELNGRIARTNKKLIEGKPLRLCYVGSMAQLYKGPDVLINAFSVCIKRGCNLEMIMLGDGRFKPKLEEQAKKLGLQISITFTGNVSPASEVFRQLDISDIFILPSRVEGLPRALIEAMARGLPAISSEVGGIPELLDKEDILVPGNYKTLADKIIQVVGNMERIKRMSKHNVEKARTFESNRLNEKRIEFHKMIMVKTREYQQNQHSTGSN